MTSTKWLTIAVVSILAYYLLNAGPTVFVSAAQTRSSVPSLEPTVWQTTGEISLSGGLEKRQFVYWFKDGKVRVGFRRDLFGFLAKPHYNPITGRTETSPTLTLISTLTDQEVCTYTLDSNSIHIKCSDHYVDATINGNRMEGILTLDPDNRFKANWAVVLTNDGRKPKERSRTQSSQADEPTNFDKVSRAGRAFDKAQSLTEQEKYSESIANFTEVIELTCDSDVWNHICVAAYFGRGNAKLKSKDLRSAIGDYTKAIQLSPASPTEEPKDEGARFALALTGFYDLRTAYLKRGITRELVGDKTGACEDFHRSCRMGDHDSCDAVERIC